MQAAASFHRARELDPGNAEAVAGLGEVALAQGQVGDALVHLEAAVRVLPSSSRIHTLCGQAYLSVGKPRPAALAFKKALKLNPDNDAARKGYEEAAALGGE